MRCLSSRKRQDRFLLAFKKIGTIFGACRAAKIGRETVRKWRKEDPAFEARLEEADVEITEQLEEWAMRKAKRADGTIMNIFLLKARRPEKYRDNSKIELTGPVPLNIQLSDDKGGDAPTPSPKPGHTG